MQSDDVDGLQKKLWAGSSKSSVVGGGVVECGGAQVPPKSSKFVSCPKGGIHGYVPR